MPLFDTTLHLQRCIRPGGWRGSSRERSTCHEALNGSLVRSRSAGGVAHCLLVVRGRWPVEGTGEAHLLARLHRGRRQGPRPDRRGLQRVPERREGVHPDQAVGRHRRHAPACSVGEERPRDRRDACRTAAGLRGQGRVRQSQGLLCRGQFEHLGAQQGRGGHGHRQRHALRSADRIRPARAVLQQGAVQQGRHHRRADDVGRMGRRRQEADRRQERRRKARTVRRCASRPRYRRERSVALAVLRQRWADRRERQDRRDRLAGERADDRVLAQGNRRRQDLADRARRHQERPAVQQW